MLRWSMSSLVPPVAWRIHSAKSTSKPHWHFSIWIPRNSPQYYIYILLLEKSILKTTNVILLLFVNQFKYFFVIYSLPGDWCSNYTQETMVVQMTWVWSFSTIIAIIRACACWALLVVTLTNTVHLIYIYIYNLKLSLQKFIWKNVGHLVSGPMS